MTMNDDYLDNISTTGRVVVGEQINGHSDGGESHDSDWIGVELIAGHHYEIRMDGDAESEVPLSDPYIRGVMDANGVRIDHTANDDGDDGFNSLVTFIPEKDGLYFISAGSYGFPYGDNPTPYTSGHYTVSVSDITPEVPEIIVPEVDSGSSSRGSSSSSSSSSSSLSPLFFFPNPDASYIADYVNNHPIYQEPPHVIDNFIEGTTYVPAVEAMDAIEALGLPAIEAAEEISGDDNLHGTSGNDYIRARGGNDTVTGYAGNDIILGVIGENTLHGGPGHDQIYAGSRDTINGDGGKDIIFGDHGNDIINGGPGRDLIYGSWGNDTINGGPGNDILVGGDGEDTFVFGRNDGRDIIVDFNYTDYPGAPGTPDKIKFDVPGLTFEDLRIVYHAITGPDSFTTSSGDVTITGAGTTIYVEGMYFETYLFGAEDFIFI